VASFETVSGLFLLEPMATNRRYFSHPIVALEEIMPRAINIQQKITERQQITERIVAIVLAAAICLILVSAVMDVPIKLLLP
jgi:hypothetical protein